MGAERQTLVRSEVALSLSETNYNGVVTSISEDPPIASSSARLHRKQSRAEAGKLVHQKLHAYQSSLTLRPLGRVYP